MFSKPVGVSTRPSKDYPRVRGISDATSTLMLSPFAAIKKRPGAESERRAGIGHVAVGMARQCYDLQLTQYDEKGWRATFYTTGMEHSPTGAIGTAWERTPWRATQRAAWMAVRRATDEHGEEESACSSLGRRVGVRAQLVRRQHLYRRTGDRQQAQEHLLPRRRCTARWTYGSGLRRRRRRLGCWHKTHTLFLG